MYPTYEVEVGEMLTVLSILPRRAGQRWHTNPYEFERQNFHGIEL